MSPPWPCHHSPRVVMIFPPALNRQGPLRKVECNHGDAIRYKRLAEPRQDPAKKAPHAFLAQDIVQNPLCMRMCYVSLRRITRARLQAVHLHCAHVACAHVASRRITETCCLSYVWATSACMRFLTTSNGHATIQPRLAQTPPLTKGPRTAEALIAGQSRLR